MRKVPNSDSLGKHAAFELMAISSEIACALCLKKHRTFSARIDLRLTGPPRQGGADRELDSSKPVVIYGNRFYLFYLDSQA